MKTQLTRDLETGRLRYCRYPRAAKTAVRNDLAVF